MTVCLAAIKCALHDRWHNQSSPRLCLLAAEFLLEPEHVKGRSPKHCHPCRASVDQLLTFKGRQEGVVDVDGMLGMPRAEVLTEDLHVPCQHEQVYIHLLQQGFNLRLLHKARSPVECRLQDSLHRAQHGRFALQWRMQICLIGTSECIG